MQNKVDEPTYIKGRAWRQDHRHPTPGQTDQAGTGVALHIIDLGGNAIDTTSAAGRFMLVVLAGAAEMERNLIRERTKSALAVKRANGQRISRTRKQPPSQ